MASEELPERVWVQKGLSIFGTDPDQFTLSAFSFDPREVHDSGKPVYQYIRADLVASAIATERERCAEIALAHHATLNSTCPGGTACSEGVAAAIRNQSGETQPKSSIKFCETCFVATKHELIGGKWECQWITHYR